MARAARAVRVALVRVALVCAALCLARGSQELFSSLTSADASGGGVLITAGVEDDVSGVAAVDLEYTFAFTQSPEAATEGEDAVTLRRLSMLPVPELAGGWRATIPVDDPDLGRLRDGSLVRYAVVARDARGGELARRPSSVDAGGQRVYRGHVVGYAAIANASKLPAVRAPSVMPRPASLAYLCRAFPQVFWYTDDVEASKGDTPTPGSLAFAPMDASGAAAGELRYYDQVEVHRMGSGRHDGSVKQLNAAMKSREWPKHKFEVEFTGKRAHLWAGAPQPKRISLRSMFKESGPVSYMREALALRLMNDIGVASQRAAHVRLFLNGEFYGLYLLADEIDSTWLERQRWPADTILLKAQHWKVRADALRSTSQSADAPAVLQPASPRPPPGVSADAA